VFGGKTKIDLQRALAKLRTKFGIRKLLLEGGGSINGSFLNADLIDELSVLIVPVADGSIGAPTLFDAREKRAPTRKLRLLSVRRIERDMIWVRYKIR
jgi:riboflavin biosynthesis pyrimidine reductase